MFGRCSNAAFMGTPVLKQSGSYSHHFIKAETQKKHNKCLVIYLHHSIYLLQYLRKWKMLFLCSKEWAHFHLKEKEQKPAGPLQNSFQTHWRTPSNPGEFCVLPWESSQVVQNHSFVPCKKARKQASSNASSFSAVSLASLTMMLTLWVRCKQTRAARMEATSNAMPMVSFAPLQYQDYCSSYGQQMRWASSSSRVANINKLKNIISICIQVAQFWTKKYSLSLTCWQCWQ